MNNSLQEIRVKTNGVVRFAPPLGLQILHLKTNRLGAKEGISQLFRNFEAAVLASHAACLQ